MQKRRRSKIIAIFIFIILVVILSLIALTERVSGDEELMWCDGCDKSVQMKYEDSRFTEIHLIYEWDD